MDKEQIRSLMAAVTARSCPPLVPELELALVTSSSPWWTMSPEDLAASGVPEPFWAFAWAGGQSLARYILDHPEWVRGKSVIDFGAGCGIVSLAALKAGAFHVTATEIDPWAMIACERNVKAYSAKVSLSCEDWIGRPLAPGSILLCGDMSYDADLCRRLLVWFESLHACTILAGDPGRGFLNRSLFTELASYLAPADSDSDGRYKVNSSVFLWRTGITSSLPLSTS